MLTTIQFLLSHVFPNLSGNNAENLQFCHTTFLQLAENGEFIREARIQSVCRIKGSAVFEVLSEDGCARVPLIAFSCLKRGVAWKIWPPTK
jgi:hypothetical protein